MGQQSGATLTIGINGAGGNNSGNNASFAAYVQSLGGQIMSRRAARSAIEGALAGTTIALYGYSRGGNAAIDIANWAGSEGIMIDSLTTFDPHKFVGDFELEHNNVGTATNYFQRNPQTSGILPFGSNPYQGRSVSSRYIQVNQTDFTGNNNVNHLNIVTTVTGF
jgi:hypothetical protein